MLNRAETKEQFHKSPEFDGAARGSLSDEFVLEKIASQGKPSAQERQLPSSAVELLPPSEYTNRTSLSSFPE